MSFPYSSIISQIGLKFQNMIKPNAGSISRKDTASQNRSHNKTAFWRINALVPPSNKSTENYCYWSPCLTSQTLHYSKVKADAANQHFPQPQQQTRIQSQRCDCENGSVPFVPEPLSGTGWVAFLPRPPAIFTNSQTPLGSTWHWHQTQTETLSGDK